MSDDPRFVINVEGAVYRGDRWLLVRRSEQEPHAGGTLALIGGKVEYPAGADDILETTLRREIHEEVGVEVAQRMHYIESKSFLAGDGDPVVDIVFVCQYLSGDPRPVDRAEVSEVYWLTATEVEQHPNAPSWTRRSVCLAEALRVRLADLAMGTRSPA